jgi:hypothetical protein
MEEGWRWCVQSEADPSAVYYDFERELFHVAGLLAHQSAGEGTSGLPYPVHLGTMGVYGYETADMQYYCRRFDKFPYLLASDPYDLEEIRLWGSSKQRQRILDLSGPELMCAFKAESLHAQEGSNREGAVSDARVKSTA